MTQPAHPRFPSLPAASSSRAPLPSPPATSAQVLQLLHQCTSPQAARDLIVPLLQQTAEGAPYGGAGLNERTRQAYGEKTLALEKEEVYGLPDTEVQRLTAALVYILSARLTVSTSNAAIYNDTLFQFALRLCALGDPLQFSLCPARVSTFAWGMLRLSQKVQKVDAVVQALASLIQRSATPNTFTGAYAAFLEACLLTRDYTAAQLVLDQLFLDVRSASPSYLDVLTYFHHAGLVHAAVQQFAKAKQCFVTALALPTQTASAIQLAAAKRAHLCELLDTGKRLNLPKYTPGAVSRVSERNAQTYIDLAQEYEAGNWSGVRKLAEQRVFDQDCNRGLVDQVVSSIIKRRVLQVGKIYSRLTIDDLAIRVGVEGGNAAHSLGDTLQEMISTGTLDATLSMSTTPGSAIVTFTSSASVGVPSARSSTRQLASSTYLASVLEAQLVEAGRQAGLSKEYLKKQANLLENTKGNGRGRNDEFDQLMAAEEAFGGAGDRAKRGLTAGGGGFGAGVARGVGADWTDMGF